MSFESISARSWWSLCSSPVAERSELHSSLIMTNMTHFKSLTIIKTQRRGNMWLMLRNEFHTRKKSCLGSRQVFNRCNNTYQRKYGILHHSGFDITEAFFCNFPRCKLLEKFKFLVYIRLRHSYKTQSRFLKRIFQTAAFFFFSFMLLSEVAAENHLNSGCTDVTIILSVAVIKSESSWPLENEGKAETYWQLELVLLLNIPSLCLNISVMFPLPRHQWTVSTEHCPLQLWCGTAAHVGLV